MATNAVDRQIAVAEQEIREMEDRISEPNGMFCKSMILKMFSASTSSEKKTVPSNLDTLIKFSDGRIEALRKAAMLTISAPSYTAKLDDLIFRYMSILNHFKSMLQMVNELIDKC